MRKRKVPNIPVTASRIVMNEPARFRLRTTRSGRRGLGPLLCHRTNALRSTPATTRATIDVGAAPAAGAGFAEPVHEGHQAAAPEDDAEHVQPDAREARARRDQP